MKCFQKFDFQFRDLLYFQLKSQSIGKLFFFYHININEGKNLIKIKTLNTMFDKNNLNYILERVVI